MVQVHRMETSRIGAGMGEERKEKKDENPWQFDPMDWTTKSTKSASPTGDQAPQEDLSVVLENGECPRTNCNHKEGDGEKEQDVPRLILSSPIS